jgi:plastocyanin
MNRTALASLLCLLLVDARAEEAVVALKNIAFSRSNLTIDVGDKVRFVNEDPLKHNVYSADEPGSFDLGAYGKGESRSVEFRDPGLHEIRCSIHSTMRLTVTVRKAPSESAGTK